MHTKNSTLLDLNTKVEALRLMIEPEEFIAASKELIELMRSVPLDDRREEWYALNISGWEQSFNTIARILGHYREYRKNGSKNKLYSKPALNIPETKSLLETIRLMILESNLPDFYMPRR